ncbi:E3 ubiquitin-protein ligase RNF186 [Tachyglossus aculeatus]|uniref:E3 ubiquitin-protein ligase RNF186 n=1 Tax=Tachyglossus aculeatus TaxID=9261 RepID=UPI0018F7AB27|nr:E3 ubiquitin-protein ligase RNF186 [Tachyglossus aculeatus]
MAGAWLESESHLPRPPSPTLIRLGGSEQATPGTGQRGSPRASAGERSSPDSSEASDDRDVDCVVCCNRYGPYRPPKLLACQHAFCAVCLKLLLRVKESAWVITCPLCRENTAVPGGLIGGLRDHEEERRQMEKPRKEVRLAPQSLEGFPGSQARGFGVEENQDSASANRVAARSLMVHLLLLGLLIVLILPFVYPGVMKWVLCSLTFLALALSGMLCLHSSYRRRFSSAANFAGQPKDSPIVSIT